MVLGQVELKMVVQEDQEVVHQVVLHQQEDQEIHPQFHHHKEMMEEMVEVALEDQEVVVLVQQV